MKVMIVTNIPNPYRIPLFNLLHTDLAEKGVKLRVVFGSKTYKRRMFEIDLNECLFDYSILHSHKISIFSSERILFSYSGIWHEINVYKPDRIIVVGFSLATLKIFIRSFFRRTPYIIWSGSIINKGRRDSLVRKLFRRMLIKRASGFLAYGTMAKEYLISLGATEENVFIAINTVDTEFFSREVSHLRKDRTRKDIKNLLYVGYLTQGKRIDLILEMIAQLLNYRRDFRLYIIGDGPSMPKVQKIVEICDLDEYVIFTGFKQKNDLPPYYAMADCFLFASEYDIWGLVLNEALSAGVPCIASKHAGATRDLIKEGKTGFGVNFEDTKEVARLINDLFSDKSKLREMKQLTQVFISNNASLNNTVFGFLRVLGVC